jgi:hypothetical protein
VSSCQEITIALVGELPPHARPLSPKGVCVRASYDEAIDPGWDPLTRPAPADEGAVAGHPLPQGGEGPGVRGLPFGNGPVIT